MLREGTWVGVRGLSCGHERACMRTRKHIVVWGCCASTCTCVCVCVSAEESVCACVCVCACACVRVRVLTSKMREHATMMHARSCTGRRGSTHHASDNCLQGMQAAGARHASPMKGRGTPQFVTPSSSVQSSPAHSIRSPRGGGSGGRQQQQVRMDHNTAAW